MQEAHRNCVQKIMDRVLEMITAGDQTGYRMLISILATLKAQSENLRVFNSNIVTLIQIENIDTEQEKRGKFSSGIKEGIKEIPTSKTRRVLRNQPIQGGGWIKTTN